MTTTRQAACACGAFLVALAALPTEVGAQRIFALLVADTKDRAKHEATFVGEDTVSKANSADLDRMKRLFVENVPRDNLILWELKGEQVTRQNIVARIELLNLFTPGPRDTLVFYFSGNGATDPDRGLFFDLTGEEVDLSRSDVRAALEKHGAGFNAIISDVPANEGRRVVATGIPGEKRTSVLAGNQPITPSRSPEDFSPLFLDLFVLPKGTLEANGASPGQEGWVFGEHGSIFTTHLEDVLRRNREGLETQRVTWRAMIPVVARGVKIDAEKIVSGSQDVCVSQYPRSVR